MPTKQKFSTREKIPHITDAIREKKRKLHSHITQCKSRERLNLYESLQDCDDATLAKLTDVFSIVLKRRIC